MLGPLAVLTATEAVRLAADYRTQAARSGSVATRNRHVDLPALQALCATAKLWQPLHDLLGERLLLWRTNLFLGNPLLPWHEDRHSGLFDGDAFSLSMLLAIEDSPPDNCAVFIPGSHRLSQSAKQSRYGIRARPQAMGNVRYSGEISRRLQAPMVLRAGQAVVFHPRVLHASSGYLNGQCHPSGERMSLTLRVASWDARLREQAFPGEHESADTVMRTIRHPAALPD